MTQIFTLDRIQPIADRMDVSPAMEEGFKAYTKGEVVVPPVGELIFEDPPGDAHIKYGYIKGDDWYVIKIASGFYENHRFGLPSSSGLMLLFSQKTGRLESVLLDEGYLTNVRTAAAGRVAAKYLAPKTVRRIGVFGTGVQARMQVRHLDGLIDCRDLSVWGRSDERLDEYRRDMEAEGYRVSVGRNPAAAVDGCDLVIMATPSQVPLVRAEWLQPGAHVTAVGSDTPDKQELDAGVLERADIVVADSIGQCLERGEIFKAISAGKISPDKPVELGAVIMDPSLGRTSDEQLTVADLTGVAVQDVQIAKAVHAALSAVAGDKGQGA